RMSMSKTKQYKTAKVGHKEIDVTKTVRDIRGVDEIVKESIEKTWSDNLVNQMKVWLTPFPEATDIAEWDRMLLERYPPLYTVTEKTCRNCLMGPCELDKGKGTCGLGLETYQAKLSLQASCRGLSVQLSGTRDLLNHCIKEFGEEKEINWGKNVAYGMMNVNTLCGFTPKTLTEANRVVTYLEDQLTSLLASASVGYEQNVIDLESKALHTGSLLLAALDINEFLKHAFFDFCWGAERELVELPTFPEATTPTGLGSVDTGKPTLVFMGFDFLPAWNAVQYIKANGLEDTVEVTGIGSVGHDLVRFYEKAKILTSPVKAGKAFRMGIADVIVVSDTCCKTNVLEDARRTDAKVIATSFKQNMGLVDRIEEAVDDIVKEFLSGASAVLITDPKKAGEVAVKLVQAVKAQRKESYLLSMDEIKEWASKCDECDACFRVCPNSLHISAALMAATDGNNSRLCELHDKSIYCGKCEEACPHDIPIIDMIISAAQEEIREDKALMKAGRGTFSNLEVRDWAITVFSCPGSIVIMGCNNYKGSDMDIAYIASELISNTYSVTVAGCAASDIARHRDKKTGKFLYELYPSLFNPKCLVNTGGCSGQSHFTTAFYKVGYMGFRSPYRATYTLQSDFTTRFPNVLVIWGPASELMYTLASGYARAGIPVILGPGGFNFKRYLMGNKYDRSKWWALHGNTGKKGEVDPIPEHMIVPVETKEEVLALIPKLCLLFQDMEAARQTKFDFYLDYYKNGFGVWPDDWHLYVRREVEIPLIKKVKVLRLLEEEYGWEIDRKKGRVIRARHRDGRLIPMEKFLEEYGFPSGQYITLIPRLVYKERADRE
ncbi:MAG: hypothetical protein ABID54_12795, partial [Pseudomonadota bacterium]